MKTEKEIRKHLKHLLEMEKRNIGYPEFRNPIREARYVALRWVLEIKKQ